MIKLALIGRGKWGKNYLDEVKRLKDVSIDYVRTYDWRDLIGKKEIDGIIIATPDSTHIEIIKAFPDKFLLVEKPLTTSLKDTLSISSNKIMVGHIYLYNTGLLEAIEKAGNIQVFRFKLGHFGLPQDVTPLYYLAVHPISIAIYLFGTPIKVKAWEYLRILFIELEYSNKVFCKFEIKYMSLFENREITIWGDKVIYFADYKQYPSPLQNELQEFVDFIKGIPCRTDLAHGIQVAGVLNQIEQLLK